LTAKNGFVVSRDGVDVRVAYGALARGQRIESIWRKKPALKDPAAYAVMGKPLRGPDGLDK